MRELRSWTNDRRVDAGMTSSTWSDNLIVPNQTKIKATHFDEVRTAISQAYSTCGRNIDPNIGGPNVTIRGAHLEELRKYILSIPEFPS